MTNERNQDYQVTVIERALAFYEVEAEDARSAAENWSDGEYGGRDDEALDTEGPTSVRERQPDGTWRKVPDRNGRTAVPPAQDGMQPYSVLLLYPDYAQRQRHRDLLRLRRGPRRDRRRRRGPAAGGGRRRVDIDDPDDFAPLLVTQGHHYGEPLFNK